jgi:hypothetical protein
VEQIEKQDDGHSITVALMAGLTIFPQRTYALFRAARNATLVEGKMTVIDNVFRVHAGNTLLAIGQWEFLPTSKDGMFMDDVVPENREYEAKFSYDTASKTFRMEASVYRLIVHFDVAQQVIMRGLNDGDELVITYHKDNTEACFNGRPMVSFGATEPTSMTHAAANAIASAQMTAQKLVPVWARSMVLKMRAGFSRLNALRSEQIISSWVQSKCQSAQELDAKVEVEDFTEACLRISDLIDLKGDELLYIDMIVPGSAGCHMRGVTGDMPHGHDQLLIAGSANPVLLVNCVANARYYRVEKEGVPPFPCIVKCFEVEKLSEQRSPGMKPSCSLSNNKPKWLVEGKRTMVIYHMQYIASMLTFIQSQIDMQDTPEGMLSTIARA